MILVAVLIVVGVIVLGKKDVENPSIINPNTKPTSETTSEPETPVEIPSSIPTGEPKEATVYTEDMELAEAQLAFPNVNATPLHTKEEIQLAMYSAYKYINMSLSDTYLLSGDFITEGYPADYFERSYRTQFTVQGYSQIANSLANVTSADEAIADESYLNLLRIANIENVSGSGYSQPEECAAAIKSCLLNEQVNFGDFKYDDSIDGRVMVTVQATSKPMYINASNESGYLTNVYDFQFFMIPNDNPDFLETGASSFAIDGYMNSINRQGWTKE